MDLQTYYKTIYVIILFTFVKTHNVEIKRRDKGCTFPFVYKPNLYYKCVVDGQIPTPFCVTNRKVFEDTINIYFPNGTKTGRKTCRERGSVEWKCPKCERNFIYDGKKYSNCIYVHNQSAEKEVATLPWCITNSSSYKINPETGWMYCSDECDNKKIEIQKRNSNRNSQNCLCYHYCNLCHFDICTYYFFQT